MELDAQLVTLEASSRVLEPTAETRKAMLASVADFCDRFYTALEHPDDSDRMHAWFEFDPPSVCGDVVAKGFPTHGCITGSEVAGVPTTLNESEWHELFATLERDVITPGINSASPMMLGYVPGGGLFPSAIADFVSAATNRFAGMFFASPSAVKLENMLVRWAAEVMGLGVDHDFPDDHPENTDRQKVDARLRKVAGCLTSGGSVASISAFVCAREAHRVLSGGRDGHTPPNKFVIYMTSQVHSCVAKALNVVGVMHAQQRLIPCDDRLRMDVAALERLLCADLASGLCPWLVIVTAGTTNSGAVDPLLDATTVAHRHGCWVHCDGAYGGLYALCDEGRMLMGPRCVGLAAADSIVADPHKALFLPYGTGMVIVKDGALLVRTHSISAAYLNRFVDASDEISSTDTSLELSRHFRALRLWLPLRAFGLKAFRDAQSEKILLARYFHKKLHGTVVRSKEAEGSPEAVFVCHDSEPQLSIVMFRLTLGSSSALEPENALQQQLLKQILSNQRIFVSGTKVDGVEWLRVAIGVFRTHRSHIDAVLEHLMISAASIL